MPPTTRSRPRRRGEGAGEGEGGGLQRCRPIASVPSTFEGAFAQIAGGGKLYSEFNIVMNYAWYYHRDEYEWHLQVCGPLPPRGVCARRTAPTERVAPGHKAVCLVRSGCVLAVNEAQKRIVPPCNCLCRALAVQRTEGAEWGVPPPPNAPQPRLWGGA